MSRLIDHLVLAARDLDALAGRFAALGFTLTPRAFHEDRMGTSNRLVQLASEVFIELLEVDRPRLPGPHDYSSSPPMFSFGAHNRTFLERREGLSMLVLKSVDVDGDLADFAAAGLQTYAPFEFGRRARQPDGRELEVRFRLGFVTNPEMPEIGFFVCHNLYPENFWKAAYQNHANGALAISAVYLCAREPACHKGFLAALLAVPGEDVDGGLLFRCTDNVQVYVLTPDRCRDLAADAPLETDHGPVLAGFRLDRVGETTMTPRVTPAGDAGGAFIPWGELAS